MDRVRISVGQRRQPEQESEPETIYACANCWRPVTGPDRVPRGPYSAWHSQCRDCAEVMAGQLDLIADRPGGAGIRIYRCARCGTARTCRPGWTTRCMVCLDDRTAGDAPGERGRRVEQLMSDGEFAAAVRRSLGLPDGAPVPFRPAREAASALAVAERLRRLARPGWEVLATDIHGLPWSETGRPISHGTWGRHQPCGTIAKLAEGSVDCPACGPGPGSRTHHARREDPCLLYLVKTRQYQKFGVGDSRRIRTHVRGGAEVVQVLRAPFASVIVAEKTLKDIHAAATVRQVKRGMIESFGQGTEVVRRRTPVTLTTVLPDGEDVTHWFPPAASPARQRG